FFYIKQTCLKLSRHPQPVRYCKPQRHVCRPIKYRLSVYFFSHCFIPSLSHQARSNTPATATVLNHGVNDRINLTGIFAKFIRQGFIVHNPLTLVYFRITAEPAARPKPRIAFRGKVIKNSTLTRYL
ncbi:MAG: hypothetical protein MJY47_08915, partial [Fibrobacter sp.]|nr:hypothetical protein [Fibrobacter sp.]